MSKNYVFQAAEAYFHKEGKIDEVKKMHEEAQDRFHMVHILIAMANTEALKAIDMIEDKGLRKQMLKKYLNEYERQYGLYTSCMMRHMSKEIWALLQDYAVAAHKSIEYQCQLMRQACYNYLKQLGVKDASLLAQCEVAFLLWQIESETFDAFFDSYRSVCGVDFRKDYQYADLRKCRSAWSTVIDYLSKDVQHLDFGENKRCVGAWNDLKETIDNEDFFDNAAGKALKLNPKIYEKYLSDTKFEG